MINYLCRGAQRAVIVISVLTSLPVAAATITVTPATFASVLAAEKGGDTLKLVGTFGAERLQNRSFSKVVTIDASAATFTNSFQMYSVSNLTFNGGTFNIVGTPAFTKGVAVYDSRNIVVSGIAVNGSSDGIGIFVSNAVNLHVLNDKLDGMRDGVALSTVTNGTVSGVKITHSSSDGIDIADSHFVTATNNNCSASVPSPGAHPDCIQLWSIAGHPLQSDIIVTKNVATGATQGFTSFAPGGGELRVQITHNTVNTSYSQGVACYDCIDSTISYNNLTTMPGSQYLTNLNVIGGSGNTVVGNHVTPYTTSHGTMTAMDEDVSPPDLALLGSGNTALDSTMRGAIPGVPEPSNWAMLLAGFAAVGVVGRRGRRLAVAA